MNLLRRSSAPAEEAAARKRIFISYRRDDSQAAAGRLFDRLSQHFPDQVFIDVDAMEPGVDFVEKLEGELDQCDAFIAVIGPNWTGLKDADGNQRLNRSSDYVRLEVETALRRNIRVIPVLVDGAKMPSDAHIPEPLRPLLRRNAVEISHQKFGADVDSLAAALRRAFGTDKPEAHPAAFAQPVAATSQNPANWTDVFFSFRGRISRKTFWIGVVAVLVAQFVLLASVMAVVGGSMWQFFADGTKVSMQHKLLEHVVLAPTYWPMVALMLKRLHDFDQGRGFLIVFLVAFGAYLLADATLPVTMANPASSERNKFDHEMIGTVTSLVGLVIIVVTGCIKGAPGDNRFGPPRR